MSRIAGAGRIDRSKPLGFTFNGRKLTGYAGDTLASALLANGVHLVGRSYKYHRPRGILTAGCEEPNAVRSSVIRTTAARSKRPTTRLLRRAAAASARRRRTASACPGGGDIRGTVT